MRSYLREHRYDLSVAAAAEYRDLAKVAGTDLLTAPQWLPTEPVSLAKRGLDAVSPTAESGQDDGEGDVR